MTGPGHRIRLHWLDTGSATEADVRQAQGLLDDRERGRAGKRTGFRSHRDYVLGHALLRVILSRMQSAMAEATRPSEWRFRIGPCGKPEPEQTAFPEPLRVSLSHADGLVAVAVGLTGPLGVDVEALQRPALGLKLAQRFFHPSELAGILAAPGPVMQRRALLEVWVAKEAYAKATGLGLARTLGTAVVCPDVAAVRACAPDHPATPIRLQLFRPLPQYQGALVVLCPDEQPLCIEAAPVFPGPLIEEGLSLDS